MKQQSQTLFTLLFSGLLSISAASSFAEMRPGWERPIYQADLKIIENHGNVPNSIESAKTFSLVMTQQDGSKSPTGFILLTDGQSGQSYGIQSVTRDSCNSVTYTLVPVIQSAELVLDGVFEQVQMTDNSARTCMDFRPFRWEFDFRNLNLTRDVTGKAVLGGNPHGVITVQ
jgi:hypothetical protein